VGLEESLRRGWIQPDEEVVLQLTGSGFKDVRSALRAARQPTVVRTLEDVARALV